MSLCECRVTGDMRDTWREVAVYGAATVRQSAVVEGKTAESVSHVVANTSKERAVVVLHTIIRNMCKLYSYLCIF